jgi:hypothetical protein
MPSLDVDALAREVSVASQRVAELRRQAEQAPQHCPQLLTQALEELASFSTTLQITIEALRQQQEQLTAFQEGVEQALAELEQPPSQPPAEPLAPDSGEGLSGLLTICAACKKIRLTSGKWRGIEDYLTERWTIQFSHSFCPDCARGLYPDYYDKLNSDE